MDNTAGSNNNNGYWIHRGCVCVCVLGGICAVSVSTNKY